MIIYYTIFFCLVILAFIERFFYISTKSKKRIILIYSLILVWMSTIYSGKYGDKEAYELFFKEASSEMLFHPFNGWFEYLYTLLILVSKWISNSYTFSRFVLAIVVFSLWYSILTSKRYYFSQKNSFIILLMLWMLDIGNIFIARSTIAMTICIFSLRYVETEELKKFLIVTAIAIGFHTMSVVWIFAYFVYYYSKRYDLKKWGIIACLLPILIPSLFRDILIRIKNISPTLIQRALQHYLNLDRSNMFGMEFSIRTTMIKGMANMLLLIVVFGYILKRKKQYSLDGNVISINKFEGYFTIYILGAILYVISLGISIALSRAALPFTHVSIFLLPQLFELPECRKNIGFRFLIFGVLVLYIFLRFTLNLRGNNIGAFIIE